MTRKLVYLVTEDWAFTRHRLPMARAAREAGFDVHVITRIVDRRSEIERSITSARPTIEHRMSGQIGQPAA